MRDTHFPGRSVVMSTRAMVATSQPMATEAALDILRRGGNALDAAIAASAVQSVTEPQATGIGGDCFLLYHDAGSNTLHALNGSGRAPAEATIEAYRARGHEEVPERGILSITVPGAIDAWQTAHERFGQLAFGTLLQHAIDLADGGYAIGPVVARSWRNQEALLRRDETSAGMLLDAQGNAPAAGTQHRQPELAATLRAIAREGRDAFYRGPIAETMVRYCRERGGLLSLEDLANHQSDWVTPISTRYRDLDVYEVPPNTLGVVTLMTLNILEAADDWPRLEPGSAEHIHLLTEAFKLAYADGLQWVGDPENQRLPVDELLSKDYARRQLARIDRNRTAEPPVPSGFPPHRDTVYLAVVDENGNVASVINSIYHAWGSGIVAGDTGVMLQNRCAGFVLDPDHVNALAPGKRPMHTILPAMAYRDGRPLLAFGVMGGSYQALGQAYVLTNWRDFGMDLQEAVDAPRFQPENNGILTVERSVPAAARDGLARRGHRLGEADLPIGGAQMILLDADQGVLHGASDPRKDGCALGY